jgi:DNA-binding response OmpR family regulator
MGQKILVADNEPEILRFVEVNLRLEGFEVVVAHDGEQALERAFAELPDLVLLDITLPKLNGFEVCRRLRVDPRTFHLPVIILTAKGLTGDKVDGLTAGADDYVLKPFDPAELVARVRTTLRRTLELRAASPLTGLPGNHLITRELARRLGRGEALAVVYVDLNDFKSLNDRYGFLRGDEVIVMTAEVLCSAVSRLPSGNAFVGHVGGDDFMAVIPPDGVLAFCNRVISAFDARIREFYEPDDARRGYLELPGRRGEIRRWPMVSISLGIATTERRQYRDHRELVEVATEMKSYLKQRESGSAFAIDGRTTEGEESAIA